MSDSNLTKNLLMVCPIPSGLYPFFFEGKEEYTGMPAFKEVFLSILNDERLNKLHLLLLITEEQEGKIRVPERFKDKIKLYPIVFEMKKPVRSILRLMKGVALGRKLVKKNNIEKIAGFRSHGSAVSAMIGLITGKHNTRRLYGTFLINEIKKPKWKLFLQHPLEYLSFALPGGTLFITNDGTKGDVVFQKIGSKKLDFQFLLNGIDKEINSNIEKPSLDLPERYICYIARIVGWKRQHLLIEALKILAEENINVPPCIIVGTINNVTYYNDLVAKIEKYNIKDKVQIVSELPLKQVHYILKKSLLSFSLYHTSNLGNVFLEAISLGTPMMAINDTGSLNQFPKNIYLELENDSPALIASKIKECLENEQLLLEVSHAAKSYSTDNFQSWNDRAAKEVNLLLS